VEINRKVEKKNHVRKAFEAECRTYRKQRNPHRVLVGNSKESVRMEEASVGWKMILKGILKEENRKAWAGFVWLRYRQLAGSLTMAIDFRLPYNVGCPT
jgi:hypothetical protein